MRNLPRNTKRARVAVLQRQAKSWRPLGVSLLFFAIASFGIFQAMSIAELRNGITLQDPLHAILPSPVDFSKWIFAATYSATFLTVYFCLIDGMDRTAVAFFGFSLILLLRSCTMLLVPLDPPEGMIPLVDPLIGYFNSGQFVPTKDLFFSGHVASMFFFFFITQRVGLKRLLAILTTVVILTILWQRVHYTADVLAGAVIGWRVAVFVNQKFISSIVYKAYKRS